MDRREGAYVQVGRHHSGASEREFSRLFVKSVDESVTLVLGEIAKRAVYEVINRNYDIPRSRIPERLDEFTLALETIFGATASKTMTKVIIKRLYSKLALTFVERPDWRLPDYVAEARSRIAFFNQLADSP